MTEYVLPKVWTWDKPSGGQFASINRPIAGATHDKELPVGKHPFQLYSLATPNGQKVGDHVRGVAREGSRGAEYDAWPIHIGEGDQFGSGFVEINPNSKIPALLDRSGPEPIRVFESGAILAPSRREVRRLPARRRARRAPKPCRGCSGRWAARPSSAAASAISSPTRRTSSNIRSTATRWRPSASSTCSTAASPRTSIIAGPDYTHRRHRDLALVRRHRPWPQLSRRRRVPRDPRISACDALGEGRSTRGRRSSAGGSSTS